MYCCLLTTLFFFLFVVANHCYCCCRPVNCVLAVETLRYNFCVVVFFFCELKKTTEWKYFVYFRIPLSVFRMHTNTLLRMYVVACVCVCAYIFVSVQHKLFDCTGTDFEENTVVKF